MKALIFETLPK